MPDLRILQLSVMVLALAGLSDSVLSQRRSSGDTWKKGPINEVGIPQTFAGASASTNASWSLSYGGAGRANVTYRKGSQEVANFILTWRQAPATGTEPSSPLNMGLYSFRRFGIHSATHQARVHWYQYDQHVSEDQATRFARQLLGLIEARSLKLPDDQTSLRTPTYVGPYRLLNVWPREKSRGCYEQLVEYRLPSINRAGDGSVQSVKLRCRWIPVVEFAEIPSYYKWGISEESVDASKPPHQRMTSVHHSPTHFVRIEIEGQYRRDGRTVFGFDNEGLFNHASTYAKELASRIGQLGAKPKGNAPLVQDRPTPDGNHRDDPKSVGTISVVAGGFAVLRNGRRVPISQGDGVRPGDKIILQVNSRVTIRLKDPDGNPNDDVFVRLITGDRFVVPETPEGTSVLRSPLPTGRVRILTGNPLAAGPTTGSSIAAGPTSGGSIAAGPPIRISFRSQSGTSFSIPAQSDVMMENDDDRKAVFRIKAGKVIMNREEFTAGQRAEVDLTTGQSTVVELNDQDRFQMDILSDDLPLPDWKSTRIKNIGKGVTVFYKNNWKPLLTSTPPDRIVAGTHLTLQLANESSSEYPKLQVYSDDARGRDLTTCLEDLSKELTRTRQDCKVEHRNESTGTRFPQGYLMVAYQGHDQTRYRSLIAVYIVNDKFVQISATAPLEEWIQHRGVYERFTMRPLFD